MAKEWHTCTFCLSLILVVNALSCSSSQKSVSRAESAAIELANYYVDDGNLSQALSIIDQGLVLVPDSKDLTYNKCTILFELGRFSEAVNLCQSYLKDNRGDIDFVRLAVRLFNTPGKTQNALEFVPILLEQKSPTLSDFEMCSEVYQREGKLEDSLSVVQRAFDSGYRSLKLINVLVSINPDSPEYRDLFRYYIRTPEEEQSEKQVALEGNKPREELQRDGKSEVNQ